MGPNDMLGLESRPGELAHVASVWRSTARGGAMTSVASTQREIVFWVDEGAVRVAVRGPETVPSEVDVPVGHSSFGIVLAHGAALPHLPAGALVDAAVEYPQVTARGVVIAGEELPVPTFDTAEGFVRRLVRAGLLVRDPLVDDVIAGGTSRLGRRTVERRVRAATGLTPGAVRRIERVRRAAVLLRAGVDPLTVVARLGYHDQSHLAHALTRHVGRSASSLRAGDTALSLPYKPDALPAL